MPSQSLTAVITGCDVTAQGTPNMTVAVAAGFVIYQNAVAAVTAGNVTITAAHATLDRIDAVVSDPSGNLSALAGSTSPDPLVGPVPPDTTGYVLLATVYVINQADANYTGTIVSSVISSTTNPIWTPAAGGATLAPAQLPAPGPSMAYTFLSAAQSGDPGFGNLGFDTTATNTLTTLYIHYVNASWINTSSGGVGYSTLKDWLQIYSGRGGTFAPFYLLLWSRKSQNKYMLLEVTSFTDHGAPSAYATLGVTIISTTQVDSGAQGTTPILSTDSLDTLVIPLGMVAPTAPVTSVFGRTGAVTGTLGDEPGCLVGVVNILNGTTSWTPDAHTNTAYVECQAGGGASQGGSSSAASGGGGGGGYSASKIGTVNSGSHTVAVGAGGAAGNHAGGDTSYTKATGETGTAPLAKGGSAGAVAAATSAGGAGGPSGSGTGDITADGGAGGTGWFSSSTLLVGGFGGCTFFGSGALGAKAAGSQGGLYGGGASGSGTNALSGSAAGGNGLMRITEYT